MTEGIIEAKIECMPWLAELIPAEMAFSQTTGTRKVGIRASGATNERVSQLIPHSDTLTKKMRELTINKKEPYSEYGAILDITPVGCEGTKIILQDVDDIDDVRVVKIRLIKSKSNGWISPDAMLVFTLHCTAFNAEGEQVGQYAGSACLPFSYGIRGKKMELQIIDVYDPPLVKGCPDFMLPGGTGCKKGTIVVSFPEKGFHLTYTDFDTSHKRLFVRELHEPIVDETILASLAPFFDIQEDLKIYDVKPAMNPVIDGISPMQAPVHRTSLSKLPGGMWALMERRSATHISLWCQYIRTALSRYTTQAVSYGTPLYHAPLRVAEAWYKSVIVKQMNEWGPKENRVHPFFHLVCMITFHAVCIFDTSLYYTDDHTSETGPSSFIKKESIRSIDNRRYSEEDLSGDCDTFGGGINRNIYELQTYEAFGNDNVDNDLVKHARHVVRLYEHGMPHGAVSSKNVLVASSKDLQNHMFAWAFPRKLFYSCVRQSVVADIDLSGKMSKYFSKLEMAEYPFTSTSVKTYSGMKWHEFLQPMPLEGTGPLNPFALPSYLSACSWLYAENIKVIPQEEIDWATSRAKEIAQREILTMEFEGVLMQNLDFAHSRLGTCMMLFDFPDAPIQAIHKAQTACSHFYKVMTGFQCAALIRAGIPVVDFYFSTGTTATERVGATYANLALFSFFWRNDGKNSSRAHIPRIKPALVIREDHMKLLKHIIEMEPKPLPAQVTSVTQEEFVMPKKLQVRSSNEDMIEVTFFVRINHLEEIIDLINKLDRTIIIKAQVELRTLGCSSINPDMRVIVADVTLGIAYPDPTEINEKIPIDIDVQKQLEEIRKIVSSI